MRVIALGAASFSAGLLEPMVLSNRKLMLGVTLVLAGLLYQSGFNWRFQSSSASWLRAFFSIESLAVLFWADLTAILAKRRVGS